MVPLIVRTGVWDFFRPVKEIAFRVEAILAVFLVGLAVAASGTARLREMLRQRAVVAIAAAVLVWGAIATAVSINRLVSLESLVTIVCSIALFFGVWYASRSLPLGALLVLVPVVLVNVAVVALQEYRIWQPFAFTLDDPSHHVSSTGLLGNPNEVGAYFALCMTVLLGATTFLRGWQRWIAALGTAAALAGVFLSQARASVLAALAALLVFAMRKSIAAGIAVLVVAIGAIVAASYTTIPALTRLVEVRTALQRGEWSVATSERLVPFLSAFEMFRARPLTGLGPGTFKAEYLQYRLMLDAKYPEPMTRGTWVMFGEAHNDHLQLLAEGGLPAYALFLAALAALVPWHRMRGEHSDRARAAATIAWPMVAALFILALAFFPLQIAHTRHLLLTGAALIAGWRRE